MGVFPGDPRSRTRFDAHDDGPDSYGDGEAEIERGQSDETPVATVSQVGIGADEIPKLLPPHHEGADGKCWGCRIFG